MRIVVKVGTSTLAHPSGLINIRRVEELCKVMSDLKNAGHDIILVTSGAIGMGTGKLQLSERPRDVAAKQAAAAVGQCELMYTYDKLFAEYNHTVAQLLMTGSDFENEERHINFKNTMDKLLEFKALPIINENDTVATDEIKVGDNDTLSAMVAVNVNADLLILLSDIDGLFTADPHNNPDAKLISVVSEIGDDILALGGDVGSGLGTGFFFNYMESSEIFTENNCDMIIANGKDPNVLYDIVEGKAVGTRFIKRG